MSKFEADDIFCCEQLHINEKDKVVKYNSRFREFSIYVKPQVRQLIQYCPFCGTKFPDELSDIFVDVIRKRYDNSELSIGDLDSFDIDKEFRTDAWWRARGL